MRIVLLLLFCALASAEDQLTRVFIFAGQSNMVGSDSKVADIERFPPYAGYGEPQEDVKFWYVLGRENKTISDGWEDLAPVNGIVGPELSFARKLTEAGEERIAIIKCAAGGTHLGGDWNPDDPQGFEMYPLLLATVRAALYELDRKKVKYKLEGFMWHQGENDMFDEGYMDSYGANLSNFLKCVRRDLKAPDLRFYVGELCTKTIWGMDLRPRMYSIAQGQKAATDADTLAQYVPTAHVGVEIGGGVGLHYHYGTLGQLQHGENYAQAYLAHQGVEERPRNPFTWKRLEGESVELWVLAGHRNMEGERAFIQELPHKLPRLGEDVPFRYSLGGGVKASNGWEYLAPPGLYDTFGPELAFGRRLLKKHNRRVAIAKFTHSGSQIIDWTPEGSSEAMGRHVYPGFLQFVKDSLESIQQEGIEVELGGIVYHVGENDMSFYPYRKAAAERVASMIAASRKDLELPELRWFVSQQPPTDHERVNEIDVVSAMAAIAEDDPHTFHLYADEIPPQEKALVIDTEGILYLGEWLADHVLARK